MWFVGGLAHGTKSVLARTLIQERVPETATWSRVRGVQRASQRRRGVAPAAGGVLVAALGGRVTLALAGGLPIVAA